MLDSKEHINRIDKMRMLQTLDRLPQHLMDGVKLGLKTGPPRFRPSKLVVCGLGGSAIGGDLLCEWMSTLTDIPCVVSRSYSLPSSVDKEVLVIVASYSGNTEETLSMFEEARKQKARIVCISSGGQLAKLAGRYRKPVAKVPSGMTPRASIGYMLGGMIGVFERAGIVSPKDQIVEAVRVLENVAGSSKSSVPTISNPAKKMAHELFGTVPVIVGYGLSKPVAKRWADQFNENSKVLAFSSQLPEMDHNEIVGWMKDSRSKGFSAVMLDHGRAPPAMRRRVEVTRIMLQRVTRVHSVRALGDGPLAQMLSLVLFGDYVSIYLGLLGNEDPSSNEPIDELKAALAKK
jgi:glucose/mannose-6-phosphate isomerase